MSEEASVPSDVPKCEKDTCETEQIVLEKEVDLALGELEASQEFAKNVSEKVGECLDAVIPDAVAGEMKTTVDSIENAVEKAVLDAVKQTDDVVEKVSELVVREVEVVKKTWIQKLLQVTTQFGFCIPRLGKKTVGSEPGKNVPQTPQGSQDSQDSAKTN